MRLSLKQKSRKALVDELTHQTRTPLTILKTHVEAIEDGVIPVDSEEMATFKNQIDNITSIIENLSHMIDAEREVSKVEIKAFDLQELLNQIARGLKAQFDRKHIQFELESSSLEDESIQMLSDPYKLSQCVYNLLTNAYKYTPENGRVSVTYGLNGADVLIEIKDTGIGILPEELEKVFDAYYRGRLTSDHKGEGIGLYVARENAMQLGGTVRVTSRQGFGSTFTVTVPRKI
jgi:signal transduction histidine kinase